MPRFNIIEFYRKEYTNSPYKDYSLVFLCRGYGVVKSLQGREFWAASQFNMQDTLKIQKIRPDPRILEATTIKFSGKYYDILQTDNPTFDNKELELKVKEVLLEE